MFVPILFVGGEIDAAGFRLAGVATRVPLPGEEAAAFDSARSEATVLLVSAACARSIPRAALDAALAAPAPLMLIVPEPAAEDVSFDPAGKVRRLLGVEA
jgi:vacuolar-type H+-ATPase subunit F/Vma7